MTEPCFSGNELYLDNGLGLYDFKARMYDPALGRFTTVDPLAEKYYPLTSYAYCHNSPIFLIDPFGTADGKPNKILWGQVVDGAANLAGGLSSMTVSYFAAAEQPVLGGISLMSLGTASLGTSAIGLAQIISGFAGEELNLPNTMLGIGGRTIDHVVGLDEPIFENIGNLTEVVMGLRVPEVKNLDSIQELSKIGIVQTIIGFAHKMLNISNQRLNVNFDRKSLQQIDKTKVQSSILYEEISEPQ